MFKSIKRARNNIPLLLLLFFALPTPVLAGAILGTRITIADHIDPNTGKLQEIFPSVAYNPDRQEYLVVWYNDRDGNDDIRAQRLDKDGVKIGGPFYIAAGPGDDRRYPDVAYNSKHKQYLVVWENQKSGGYKSIRARRLSGTGALLDSSDIVLSGETNLQTPSKPAVAYASTSDRYTVVFAETFHPALTYYICAQLVTSNGTLDGTNYLISITSDPTREPDIAYNRHANRHMVVWEQYDPKGKAYMIKGIQFKGDGGTWDNYWSLVYSGVDYLNPAIAAIPNAPGNTKFLLVFQYQYSTTTHAITGRVIEEDNTMGKMVNFPLTAHDDSLPAVAGNESNQQYLVVWRRDAGVLDKSIKGVICSSTGDVQAFTYTFSGVAANRAAVDAGPLGDFLVAWQDQPVSATSRNIYGQLFGERNYLPMINK